MKIFNKVFLYLTFIASYIYASTLSDFQRDMYKNLYEIKLILEAERDITHKILTNDKWFAYLFYFGNEVKKINMSQIQIATSILYISSYSEVYNLNKKLNNLGLFISDREKVNEEIKREDLYTEINNIRNQSFDIINNNPSIYGLYHLSRNLERLTRLAYLKLSLLSSFPNVASIYDFNKKIDLTPYKKFHKKYENLFLEDALPIIYQDISKCNQICIQKEVNTFLNNFIEKVVYPKYKMKYH